MQQTRRIPRSGADRGFTLVELLVVMGIIAVLAALLLPSLGRAKVKAKQTRCLGNLKQLQVAWTMYNGESGGRLVSCTAIKARGVPNPEAWVLGIQHWGNLTNYGAVDAGVLDCTNRNGISRGLLFRYLNSYEVYRCPDDPRIVGGVRPVRSYSMNAWMNGVALKYGDPGGPEKAVYRLFQKELDITKPSGLWVFVDEDESTIVDCSFLVNLKPGVEIEEIPARRHDFDYCITFADGHIETLTLKHDETRNWHLDNRPHDTTAGGTPNPDYAKLREISTVPR